MLARAERLQCFRPMMTPSPVAPNVIVGPTLHRPAQSASSAESRLRAHDYLLPTNRPNGGEHYNRLEAGLERLLLRHGLSWDPLPKTLILSKTNLIRLRRVCCRKGQRSLRPFATNFFARDSTTAEQARSVDDLIDSGLPVTVTRELAV